VAIDHAFLKPALQLAGNPIGDYLRQKQPWPNSLHQGFLVPDPAVDKILWPRTSQSLLSKLTLFSNQEFFEICDRIGS
jgi:hypothetical protein